MAASSYVTKSYNSFPLDAGAATLGSTELSGVTLNSSGSELLRLVARPHSFPISSNMTPAITNSLDPTAPSADVRISDPEHRPLPDQITMIVGRTCKKFRAARTKLTTVSPFFRRLLADGEASTRRRRITFPELDELAFQLFVAWLHGERLADPVDFHTLQHTIGLYCIARAFEVEALCNAAMDVVCRHYRARDMTAAPFRIVYVFENTAGPCAMRDFLIATAAWRLLRQGQVSQVMLQLVRAGGEVAAALVGSLVQLHACMRDPRTADACSWHVHEVTAKCTAVAEDH